MMPDRPLLYVLDEEGNPIGLDEGRENMIMWGLWFETHDRRVQQDPIGPYVVSTVFLGADHNHFGKGPPILWETMVFERDDATKRLLAPADCRRYRSLADAKAGHLTTCQLVRLAVEQAEAKAKAATRTTRKKVTKHT